MNLKDKARQLKADIPAVFLALKAPETPWYAKVLATVTVCYVPGGSHPGLYPGAGISG